MKFAILFVIFLSGVSSLPNVEEELHAHWRNYKSIHEKSYETDEEEQMRKDLWHANRKFIDNHNKLYEAGVVTYTLAQNHLSDRTEEELRSLRNFKGNSKTLPGKVHTLSGNKIPESIDWRTVGGINPIRDQSECGACWTFSAVASLEFQYWNMTKSLISLSEEQLLSCMEGKSCKSGGVMSEAYDYLKTHKLQTRDSYPYTTSSQKCCYDEEKGVLAGVDSYVSIPEGCEDLLTDAVAHHGVISVAMNSLEPSFVNYSGGIYAPNTTLCDPKGIDHGIAIVGYGTDAKDGDFYWVRNSWGTKWGMGGYFKIARNRNNTCGIATLASYPIIKN
ncbi:hypothetical protein Ciccas_011577 [Cichlidogyrus casuarinus]|uniref:Uncharacterized protein n=1 Tax=Cichlidogyrus casuarinus TaxID=1844966 RepID=A0ABD2PS13_9PLAT